MIQASIVRFVSEGASQSECLAINNNLECFTVELRLMELEIMLLYCFSDLNWHAQYSKTIQ